MKTSIIMAVHDRAETLEQNLCQFLSVAENNEAEVIVVDDQSTDETPDILKRMKAEHPMLYTTFLPTSTVVNPSRLRLALTVGAKAAKGDYIVLADIARPPVNDSWLTGLTDGEAALVFSSKKGDDVSHVVATSLNDLRSAVTKAERKSGHGHQGKWMKYRRGLYDALCVKRQYAFDAIKLFDQDVRGFNLCGLRMSVWTGI